MNLRGLRKATVPPKIMSLYLYYKIVIPNVFRAKSIIVERPQL